MKKKISVICLIVIASLTLTVSGCGKKSRFSKDENIETFLDELLYEMVLMDPESANFLNFNEEIVGNPLPNDKLTEIGYEKDAENTELYNEAIERISDFDDGELEPHELVQKDSLEWYLNNQVEAHNFYDYQFFVNYGGFQTEFFDLMNNFHEINSLEDAEDYIARIKGFEPKMKELTTMINSQEEKDLLPPKCIFTKTILMINNQTKFTDINENSTYKSFVDKINKIDSIDEENKQKLITEVENLLTESVYPTLKTYRDLLMELSQEADRDEVGLWRLPRGDEYYQHLLNYRTTTDYTAEEIHSMGLKEVEKIQGEIRTLLDEMGYKDMTAVEAMNNISSQKVIMEPDKIISQYKDIVEKTEPYLSELFEENIIPKTPVEVNPISEELEGSIGNSYQRPSRDGKVPGTFFVDVSYGHGVANMETLLFHEAIPGHHLQMAVQAEMPYIHPISEMTYYTAFVEGWALYAEKLAYELGIYSSNESKLGYLQSELFRAARLVVDTGLHYKKWSRMDAIKYMIEVTGYSYENEIDRYIQMPGQATAYKIGEMKILELREKAKKELGDDFNLKAFHTVILEDGNVPLEVLEYKVDKYIESMK